MTLEAESFNGSLKSQTPGSWQHRDSWTRFPGPKLSVCCLSAHSDDIVSEVEGPVCAGPAQGGTGVSSVATLPSVPNPGSPQHMMPNGSLLLNIPATVL